ncbi:hypothetical protein C8A00DRAFT_19593, partial [Chaetomidium leptoderma]
MSLRSPTRITSTEAREFYQAAPQERVPQPPRTPPQHPGHNGGYTRGGAPDPGGSDHGDSDHGSNRGRDRGNHNHRPSAPREDRYRENTYETGDTRDPRASRSDFKLKRDDIGSFHPYYDDPADLGVVNDGKNIIYTDVHKFTKRIRTFTEDDFSQATEQQIIQFFPTLLGGAAVLWWSDELLDTRRRQLRSQGLESMLHALTNRFTPDAATATQSFNDAFLSLKEVAKDDSAISVFVQRKLRYARAMGILADDNTNWCGVMVQIWSSMELAIKQSLRAPSYFATLDDYMREI